MTIPTGTDVATEAAEERAYLVAGLHALAAWIASHPGSDLPTVHANWRIPGEPRGAQLALLDEVADLLGVPVKETPLGSLIASRNFGPVQAEAHLPREPRTLGWAGTAAGAA
jgi:hypothetical protein